MFSDISESDQVDPKHDSNSSMIKVFQPDDKNDALCNFVHVLRRESESSVNSANLLEPPYGNSSEESVNFCETKPKRKEERRQHKDLLAISHNLEGLSHDISIYINKTDESGKNNMQNQQQGPDMQLESRGEKVKSNRLLIRERKMKKGQEATRDKGKGTKNIIKNFGRNTITFVEASKYLFCDEFKRMGKNYLQYLPNLTRIRERITTISDMRNLWLDSEHGKLMRRISEHYFRKQALSYVFNSHVKPDAYSHHIQCRRKLRQALKDPNNFTNLT